MLGQLASADPRLEYPHGPSRPTMRTSEAKKMSQNCQRFLVKSHDSRPWSRRPARSRAISPATSRLMSSYLQDHFQGSMASEAPNVAEIAASIEGRCCRAVSQAMGANVPGQAGGLAQSANDPADRFPGESNIRGRLGAVEAMEERAGFVAAGLDPLDQGGGRLIGQGHAFFLGPAFPSNPDRGRAAAIGSGLDVRSIEVA